MEQQTGLLQEAANEIQELRRDNQLMRARLTMFDNCMMLLTAHLHSQGEGMKEDVVWKINKFIASQKE